MTNRWILLVVLPALLAVAGCATPDSRIKKNPELFASFPPDVQETVKAGNIEVGYTEDMVQIALGRPDRLYSRRTKDGETTVWAYTATDYSSDRQRVKADFRYRDSSGRYRDTSDWVWVDVRQEKEYDRLRVEFRSGVVTAIETEER